MGQSQTSAFKTNSAQQYICFDDALYMLVDYSVSNGFNRWDAMLTNDRVTGIT